MTHTENKPSINNILGIFILFAFLVTIVTAVGAALIGVSIYKSKDTEKKVITPKPVPVEINKNHLDKNDVFKVLEPNYYEKGMDLFFTFDEFPRVDSSTSNQHIIYKSFCALTDYTCTENNWDEERYIYVNELDQIGYQKFEDKIKTSKTHGAYMNLIQGETDLILVATLPSEDEQQEAKQNNIKLEVTPIAEDAFIFMKHKSNPIESLSLENVRDIYSGDIENWEELNGRKSEITAYVRNLNSGSQQAMKTLVMDEKELIELESMMIPSMIGLVNKLDEDKTGIGYSFFYYKSSMTFAPNVELLKLEGIEPTKKTIANNTYPLVTKVYLVMREEANVPNNAVLLKNWILSESGQDIIDDVGYVPLFTNY